MEKEYKVVVYDKEFDYEEYEYFATEKKAIKYAKKMASDRLITSVWLCQFDFDEQYENIEMIWESEEYES